MATNKKTKKQPAPKRPNLSFQKQLKIIIFVIAIFFALIAGVSYAHVKSLEKTSSLPNTKPLSLNTQPAASDEAAIKPTPSPVSNHPVSNVTPSTNIAQVPVGKSVRVPILTYHYIGNNPHPGTDPARDNLSVVPDLFDKQLGYLQEQGYTTITFDELYAALKGGGQSALPPKPVILTFDDGYIDFYINAFPILQKYHMKATSFIPTGLINTGYYMTWDQIKDIDSTGLISFEAHSIHHPNLTALNAVEARTEIVESKKTLESKLGKPVNFFAYPYGSSNSLVWQMVKDAGFLGAVGTWTGTLESEGNTYDWPRVKVPGGTTVQELDAKLKM